MDSHQSPLGVIRRVKFRRFGISKANHKVRHRRGNLKVPFVCFFPLPLLLGFDAHAAERSSVGCAVRGRRVRKELWDTKI